MQNACLLNAARTSEIPFVPEVNSRWVVLPHMRGLMQDQNLRLITTHVSLTRVSHLAWTSQGRVHGS